MRRKWQKFVTNSCQGVENRRHETYLVKGFSECDVFKLLFKQLIWKLFSLD